MSTLPAKDESAVCRPRTPDGGKRRASIGGDDRDDVTRPKSDPSLPDPDMLFPSKPFSDEEAVEIIAEAAEAALEDNESRPVPQSNVEEAIYIVRAQVVFLGNLGYLEEKEVDETLQSLQSHLEYAQKLDDPDVYGFEIAYAPRLVSRDVPSTPLRTMDTDAHYYNFRNIEPRKKLEDLTVWSPFSFDYFASLKAYNVHVASWSYRAATATILTVAAAGFFGYAGIGVVGGVVGRVLPWIGQINDEFQQLEALEQDWFVYFNALRDGELRGAVLRERYRRIANVTPGLNAVQRVAAATELFRPFARLLYRGGPVAAGVLSMSLLSSIIADTYYRYRPERCRQWLRFHSNIESDGALVRKALPTTWFNELELCVNEFQRFQNQRIRNEAFRPEPGEALREANEAWIAILAAKGSTDAAIDANPDPCATFRRIEPHFAVFVEEQERLDNAPFNATTEMRTLLVDWSAAKGAFASELAIDAADEDADYRMIRDLYPTLKAAFYARPGMGQPAEGGRKSFSELKKIYKHLQTLSALLTVWKASERFPPAKRRELRQLRDKYAAAPALPPAGAAGVGASSVDELCDAFLASRFA